MTQLIPIIQVVGPWIVKVDRQFHQPQTEYLSVEIDIALRVVSYRRHMVNAKNICTQLLSPFSPSCREHVYEDVALNYLKDFSLSLYTSIAHEGVSLSSSSTDRQSKISFPL